MASRSARRLPPSPPPNSAPVRAANRSDTPTPSARRRPRRSRFSLQYLPSDREVDLMNAGHVCRQRLAIRQLGRSIRPLGIQQVEQRAAALLVHVGGDIERLLRLIQVAGLVERHDLLAR